VELSKPEMTTQHTLGYVFDRLGWLESGGYLSRKLLFLDLNFWIRLSNPRTSLHKELKKLIADMVEAGKLLCPVSASLLMELAKRPRDTDREGHSQLMDTFSKGVSLRMVHETFREEFKAALQGSQVERQAVYSHFFDACSKEIIFPASEGSAESEVKRTLDAVLANYMFNYLTTMSITKFMNEWMKDATQTIVAHLRQGFEEKSQEEGKWRQQNVVTSKAVEPAEFWGTLQELSTEIQHVLQTIDPKLSRNLESRLIIILDSCPSFWCHYKIMSKLRLDRPAVEENDIWDFLHVSLAVPYVDCLACDKATRHLCSNVLGMNKKYGTQILSGEYELLAWLQSLS
jgi:hypothetical protein